MSTASIHLERWRVATNIDFDKEGKQVSYIGVPISTDDSAYGTVPVPITIIKNGQRPTLFLSGGVHGDEFEGPIALMELAQNLETRDVQGRIIITPCLNLPAVLAGKRCSPMDGLNLNRVWQCHHGDCALRKLCDTPAL